MKRPFAIFIIGAFFIGCSEEVVNVKRAGTLNPGSSPAPSTAAVINTLTYSATVSWIANRETKVNSPGGGYRVTYSKDLSFPVGQSAVIAVPWTEGPLAPTAVKLLDLSAGTYYVKVQGYSDLFTGESSPVIPVTVP